MGKGISQIMTSRALQNIYILSLPKGKGEAFVSRRVHPYFVAIFHKYISIFRLGSIFKQGRRSLPQADK